MKTTESLKNEHSTILAVLDAIEDTLPKLGGADGEHEWLDAIVDFLEGYVRKGHIAKEEEVLFPTMEERGVAREHGPIDGVLDQHNQIREQSQKTIQAVRNYQKGRAPSPTAVRESLRDYAQLLRTHIQREDSIFLWLADHVMEPADDSEVSAALEAFETEHPSTEGQSYQEIAEHITEIELEAPSMSIEEIDLQLSAGPDRLGAWEADEIQIMRVRLKPDEALPHHKSNSEVVLLPLEGQVRVETPDADETVQVGHALSVPYETPMDVSNAGEDVVKFLVIKTPHPRVMARQDKE